MLLHFFNWWHAKINRDFVYKNYPKPFLSKLNTQQQYSMESKKKESNNVIVYKPFHSLYKSMCVRAYNN